MLIYLYCTHKIANGLNYLGASFKRILKLLLFFIIYYFFYYLIVLSDYNVNNVFTQKNSTKNDWVTLLVIKANVYDNVTSQNWFSLISTNALFEVMRDFWGLNLTVFIYSVMIYHVKRSNNIPWKIFIILNQFLMMLLLLLFHLFIWKTRQI